MYGCLHIAALFGPILLSGIVRKMYIQTCEPSKDSDQPVHLHSLIKILTGCIMDRQGCKVFSCREQRLRSDCLDVDSENRVCGCAG